MADEYKVIVADIHGVKCDTHGCGWRDDSVLADNYSSWLNSRCPKCGGNLLTQKDFDRVIQTILTVDKINRWCNKWLPKRLLRLIDARRPGAKQLPLDMDGSGKLQFKRIHKR